MYNFCNLNFAFQNDVTLYLKHFELHMVGSLQIEFEINLGKYDPKKKPATNLLMPLFSVSRKNIALSKSEPPNKTL